MTSNPLSEVAGLLKKARLPLFITGAGLSTASGLPTYRGIGGLYEDRETDHGMPIEEALSAPTFATRPEITWTYLWEVAEACRGMHPNRGHEILAEIEQKKGNGWVLTQNVDGFHHRAGTKNLIEIHGRAEKLRCLGTCDDRFSGEAILYGGSLKKPEVPRCPHCSKVLRPEVVLFGESLPDEEVEKLMALQDQPVDLVISIGTSSLFPYISEPVLMAKDHGIPTVEINVGKTDLSGKVDYSIEMDGVAALEALWG